MNDLLKYIYDKTRMFFCKLRFIKMVIVNLVFTLKHDVIKIA